MPESEPRKPETETRKKTKRERERERERETSRKREGGREGRQSDQYPWNKEPLFLQWAYKPTAKQGLHSRHLG